MPGDAVELDNVIRFQRQSNKIKDELVADEPNMADEMANPPTKDEIAYQLEAVEARGDTKLAQILGELRTGFATLDGKLGVVSTRLDGLERATGGTKMTIVGTAIAAVAVIIAIMAYGQAWFGLGVTSRDTIKSVVTEVIQQQKSTR